MDFTQKYTNALNGNQAIMFLNAPIGPVKGQDDYIRGQYFADEMYYHYNAGRSIMVYINSPGGRIFDGLNIVQAVIDTEADTHIVGMAASMAGIIGLFGKNRSINDVGIGMVHPPQGEKDTLLEMCRGQLKTALTNRSKMSAQRINTLMADDAPNTWLDASQMLEFGLVDKVVNTGKKAGAVGFDMKKINGEDWNIQKTFQFYTNLVNELAPTVKKPKIMEQTALAALLGLPTNSTEAELTAKIAEYKALESEKAKVLELTSKVASLENEKTAADTAKVTLENQIKAERTARATELVNNAITAGKISDAVRTDYINMAETNFDLVKRTIDGIKTATAHASAHNFVDMNGKAAVVTEDTYENLAKNDPAKLKKIAETEPAKFNALIAAYESKSK